MGLLALSSFFFHAPFLQRHCLFYFNCNRTKEGTRLHCCTVLFPGGSVSITRKAFDPHPPPPFWHRFLPNQIRWTRDIETDATGVAFKDILEEVRI